MRSPHARVARRLAALLPACATLAASACGTSRPAPPAVNVGMQADSSAARTGDRTARADSTRPAVAERGDVGRVEDAAATGLTWVFGGIVVAIVTAYVVMRGGR